MKALRCINPMDAKFQKRLKWFFIIGLFMLLMVDVPFTAHASLGGYELPDLYQDITDETNDTNALISKALEFATTSPYSVMAKIPRSGNVRAMALQIHKASMSVALVVATMLLMVDFFRKSANFEWASRWENILIFLVKVIVIKQVVQNCDVIISHVYAAFNYIVTYPQVDTVKFLPQADMVQYHITMPDKGDSIFQWAANKVKGSTVTYEYNISKDAVHIFYPDANFLTGGNYDLDPFMQHTLPPVKRPFIPILEKFLKMPYFLAFKAMAIMIFVITIGRTFELCIYTLLAPLPMATFASETTHDVAKNFLKKYIAVVIQVAVILVMFAVYSGVTNYMGLSNTTATTSWSAVHFMHFVAFMSLGLGVLKSGAWAKSICGVA